MKESIFNNPKQKTFKYKCIWKNCKIKKHNEQIKFCYSLRSSPNNSVKLLSISYNVLVYLVLSIWLIKNFVIY